MKYGPRDSKLGKGEGSKFFDILNLHYGGITILSSVYRGKRAGQLRTILKRCLSFPLITLMKDIIVNGKTGQETVNKKLVGGLLINVNIPGAEAEKLALYVLEKAPSKLKAMLFDYGLDSESAIEVGYVAPGAQTWKEGLEIPVTQWTEKDTADYIAAVEAYASIKRAGGGFSLETRQATWDKKAAELKEYNMPDQAIAKILGKRPEAKVSVMSQIEAMEAKMA